MHHSTDRITNTTAFVTPVVEHWLERDIAQWVLQEYHYYEPVLSHHLFSGKAQISPDQPHTRNLKTNGLYEYRNRRMCVFFWVCLLLLFFVFFLGVCAKIQWFQTHHIFENYSLKHFVRKFQ